MSVSWKYIFFVTALIGLLIFTILVAHYGTPTDFQGYLGALGVIFGCAVIGGGFLWIVWKATGGDF